MKLWINEGPASNINIDPETVKDFLENIEHRRISIFTEVESQDWDDIFNAWADEIRKSTGDTNLKQLVIAFLREHKYSTMPENGSGRMLSDYITGKPKHLLRAILEHDDQKHIIENAAVFRDTIHNISAHSEELIISDRYLLKCTDVLLMREGENELNHVTEIPDDDSLSSIQRSLQFIISCLPCKVEKLIIYSEMALRRDFIRIAKRWGCSENNARQQWKLWLRDKERSMRLAAEKICSGLSTDREGGLILKIMDCSSPNFGDGLEHDRFIEPIHSCFISSAGFNNIDDRYTIEADLNDLDLSPPTYIISVDQRRHHGNQSPIHVENIRPA